jgi:hypothetical protein
VVYDWGRVVGPDDAPTALLERQGGFPGLVDVLSWVLCQLGHPLPDVVSFLIFVSEEGDGGVDLPILVEEGRRGKPEPVSIIQGVISIKKILVENVSAGLPVLPEVPTSEEACD